MRFSAIHSPACIFKAMLACVWVCVCLCSGMPSKALVISFVFASKRFIRFLYIYKKKSEIQIYADRDLHYMLCACTAHHNHKHTHTQYSFLEAYFSQPPFAPTLISFWRCTVCSSVQLTAFSALLVCCQPHCALPYNHQPSSGHRNECREKKINNKHSKNIKSFVQK